jgi:hypothetical protein
MIKKVILLAIFLLGLGYLFWGGDVSVLELPAIPNSAKSTEPDDTYVYPNTVAYFSNSRRNEVVKLYSDSYQKLYCKEDILKIINPFCYFGPIFNNRRIEDANVVIKDQILVTYLEEYSYPFKSTLYINGYEPYDKNGKRFNSRSYPIIIDKVLYDTKTTLKIYQPNILSQVMIYTGIWLAFIWLVLLVRKVGQER